MFRCIGVIVVMALWAVLGSAAEMNWDGGDGDWNDANWNGGQSPESIVERNDGTRGVEDFIIISGGNVLYDANEVGSDFQMRQGNSLVISDNASWTQLTLPEWSENRWTEMDMTELVLDGGAFNRIGSKPGEGGGALIFGSWRGDDNFSEIPPPQEINIDLINGGRFVNEGQMWFGSWSDHTAGLTINMTIDDGTLDLSGGEVSFGEPGDGDWILSYGIDESGAFTENPGDRKDEDYNINFTGPGSITVGAAGIIMPFQIEGGDWTNLDPASYEDMWSAGILQANGMDSESGIAFEEVFRTEGEPGSDGYSLTSLVGGNTNIPGDITGDGRVDASDLNVIGLNWQTDGKTFEQGDLTGDGAVNASDLNVIGLNWQAGTKGAAAVPEPSSVAIWVWGLLGGCAVWRKRRS